MMHRSPSKRFLVIGLVSLSIIVFLFRERILIAIGNFLVVQDPLKPADVIHVIAGDDFRTDYAFQLYRQGFGKTVFFTGGWCDIHLYEHGAHAREKALAQGLPLDSIASDDSSVMSTYIEAERLKEWMQHSPSPVRSIIVVSDPFHMRRARWAYGKVFGDQVQIQMAPVPFALTPYQPVWWKDARSRKYVEEEYLKYVFYLLRYQYSSGSLKDWLSSFDTM